jgi:hypothetical protein
MDCLNALKQASGGSSSVELVTSVAEPAETDDEQTAKPLTHALLAHD